MAAQWKTLCDTFWSTQFWLPDGYTWSDIQSKDNDVYLPQVADINMSLAVGLLMLVVRYLYERLVIVPFAKFLGIKDRKRYVQPNPALEKAYHSNKGKASEGELQILSKKTELSIREVERWFFKRRLMDSQSSMKKFRECSWHFLFYFSAFVYGVYILWERDWFWDTKYCYIGWPNQHVDTPLYCFYLAELGFYWSLLFSSLTDVKRKDFWEMTTHHLITITLIYFSWIINFVRIGALIILVHDVSDYWMAAAKMAKYSKHQSVCEALFTCFCVIWIVTRMVIYPFRVLKSVMFELPDYVPPFSSHRMFVVLLCGLLMLHTIWTYLILKIALQKFTHGELQKDVRSDTESESDMSDEDSESEPTKATMNGTANLRTRNNNVTYKE
ncbi:ceramide synthase 2-like [Haliotis rubra]|uniref:ceramide synthase 2-like n=1 Tax=Haliotis rubra TaxID=36100 RepID=UPI001EE620DF|nr:ceramide synthase 2-like [Haliotis rubra]